MFGWKESFVVEPRPIQFLVTEGDSLMMKSHTHELVHRSRMNALRGKQDFSKWMKIRWKSLHKGPETGYPSDDQRRDLLEERLNDVSACIDKFEAAHISSQSRSQLEKAITALHEQNLILLRASDEEQLVEG